MIDCVDTALKDLLLVLAKQLYELLGAIPMDSSRLRDIVVHIGQEALVELDQMIQTALRDIKCAQTGQEIIAYEEAKEDEVVNNSLDIKSETQLPVELFVLEHHVLSQQRNVNQLEIVGMTQFNTLHTARRFVAFDDVLLANYREVRLMCQKTEHDQIGVGSVEHVPSVWIVCRPLAQLANIVKHLVLTFTGHCSI